MLAVGLTFVAFASASAQAQPTSISIKPSRVECIIGRTVQFTYTLSPVDPVAYNVTWESSDTQVATISQDGTATALRPGEATITARTDNGCTATALFVVPMPLYQFFVWMDTGEKTGYLSTDEPFFAPDGDVLRFQTRSIAFDIPRDHLDRFTLEQVLPEHPTAISLPAELTMTPRRPAKLDYQLTPADAQTAVSWLNIAPEVVSVASDGTLTALATGMSTITAQTSNGLRAACQVSVGEPHLKFFV